MPRKERTDPYAYVPLKDELIDFWASSHVGGSGLSTGIQLALKNMAIELKERRAKD